MPPESKTLAIEFILVCTGAFRVWHCFFSAVTQKLRYFTQYCQTLLNKILGHRHFNIINAHDSTP